MARGKRHAPRGKSGSPVSTTLGPQRRASRAVSRQRRRRSRRTRSGVVAISGIVLLVLAATAVGIGAVTHHKKDDSPKERTQRTLLFSVTGDDRGARATALLAYDATPKRASVVFLPPHTLVDVAGLGNVVLGSATRLGGPATAREAVSDLLGVTVDADWTLSAGSFASLVDRVGGVVVDVDVDVLQTVKGQTRILLRAGAGQRLNGASALAYATYVEKGQDEISFQARFQTVLDALVSALPDDPSDAAAKVGALGPGATLSWKADELATFLLGVKAAHAGDRYEPQVLPVTRIDTGGSSPTFSIKVDEVASLVRDQLADSIPPGRDNSANRVLVLNGVGTPGLGGTVANKLRSSPFRVVGTRNKQGFGVRESVVVVFDASEASLQKARDVARLLGLQESAVRIGTQNQSVADVIVVVGADFKP
jgi:LCP family protein required for cell wall assembly